MGNFFDFYRSPVNYNHPGTYRISAEETGFLRAECVDNNNNSVSALVKVKIPEGGIVTVGEEMVYKDIGQYYSELFSTGKVSGICWTNEYLVETITPMSGSIEQCKFCHIKNNKYFILEVGKNIRKPIKHDPRNIPPEACFFSRKPEIAMKHKFYL